MPHRVRKLLLDISLPCKEIQDFTDGKSLEEFQEDHLLQLAVEQAFEIIGEALFRFEKVDADNLADSKMFKIKTTT